jgi:hypothetical protein
VTLLPWEERPIELANLLNPAFCALLMRDTAGGYQSLSSQGLPYALAYLVLPVVLYPPARTALPSSTASLLTSWLQEHPTVQFQVATRVPQMLPYSREAVLFGLQTDLLRVDDEGELRPGARRVPASTAAETEVGECRKAAALIGRWFGKTADPSLVLALWGLRP